MSDGWASPSGEPNRPGDQPSYGGQGGRQQPPQQYGQPQYGPPQYSQPQYGQPQYSRPQYGPPQYRGPSQFKPMAPKPGVIPLRPLNLGDIFGGSVATIRGNPLATLGLSLIVQLIIAIPGVFTAIWLKNATQDVAGFTITDSEAYIALPVSVIVSYIGSIVLSGLLIVVISEAVLGRRISIGEAWRRVRPRLLALVGLSILALLAALVLIGLVVGIVALAGVTSGRTLAVILGIPLGMLAVAALIFFGIRLNLASAALVLENVGVIPALKRSWTLSHRSFWRILGITLLAGIITQFITGIAGLPGSVLTAVGTGVDGAGGLLFLIGGQLWAALVAAAVAPFITGVTGLLYIDMRIRREGLDVTLMSAAAEADHAPR